MSEHHRPHDPDASRLADRAQMDPRRRLLYLTFSRAVLVAGTLAAAGVAWSQPTQFTPQLLWLGPLLVLGFLLAEHLTIDVDIRQVGWAISFTEIPLVLGLLTAPFEVVLAAHLVAGVGSQLVRRLTSNLVYNVGVMCLEIAGPFAVYALATQVLPDGAPRWTAALLGTLASSLISVALAVTALNILRGEPRLPAALRLAAHTLVVGLLNTSVGVVGYEVAVSAPWGWALNVLVVAALVALYRGYYGLLREQRDLETLSDVSLSVARSGQRVAARPGNLLDGQLADADADEWQKIAERIREQLSAKRVVLRLRLDPAAPARALVAGKPLPEDEPPSHDDPILQLPGSQVRYFRGLDASDDVREALARRGAHEALVVPLRGANQLLGAVEAHDRLSRWRGFGRSDVQLLRTLASHLATAMDNRRLLARLRHDAYHDPLTGLLNRPGFREAAVDRLRRHTGSMVVRIDLDALSAVGDALGHSWGDRMVIAAGGRLREALGPGVPLARLEGGTFAALLADCDEEEGRRIAEQLHRELAAPYPVDRLSVEADAVVGYVQVPSEPAEEDDADVDTLLQRADVALRAARNAGDAVRGYVPSMGQIFLRRFQLVTQFRQALDTGQVRVHYQPKVALPGREVLGVEALVRWVHPEFGRLDPDEFVPAVEATGLVDALTSFVMDNALAKVRGWLDRGLRLSAAVNLSVRNLADESFPDRVAEALRRHDVPPRLLTFELTESGVMSDPERALPVLRRLHALGVVLAVDDFGTGYSSLAYLRQLPVDEVKIDKSFVLGMGTDLGDMAVVRSIVELGHSLGLTVVAEGVEEDAARDQLVEMGCDVAQGYLISRPLSEDRFEAWLRARTVRARGRRDETVLTLVR
ncbi:diguanylate cyclase/phosphodiesterase [Streptoalloteichus tenebrarius]|uniref:Diguanylate cyclase/phosphodiesterase n=1 Tax=Streptoalloteichus tenebrarius (strain ATCC 17920 / DSM 40477 / JCM 4838 / CBS 697.72 / NBRC 16177 / NCIMB 11028 / NRRL B-12390 / A12253. 1 / ISP 5477) TaxID=1933 RepID=A0ABT1HXX1_STRSD|nr:bifunctional diguanylate cyclase/phosphodiesterase [Streptoalloteichus tenebrarius]MCP2260372.1 diguanylate cyclase/phosphodiesterase [Streptoalloteichus tenebrarius]BFF02520.1 EAL domain-containing protein [Streptoalloteichus tenebrarius]